MTHGKTKTLFSSAQCFAHAIGQACPTPYTLLVIIYQSNMRFDSEWKYGPREYMSPYTSEIVTAIWNSPSISFWGFSPPGWEWDTCSIAGCSLACSDTVFEIWYVVGIWGKSEWVSRCHEVLGVFLYVCLQQKLGLMVTVMSEVHLHNCDGLRHLLVTVVSFPASCLPYSPPQLILLTLFPWLASCSRYVYLWNFK